MQNTSLLRGFRKIDGQAIYLRRANDKGSIHCANFTRMSRYSSLKYISITEALVSDNISKQFEKKIDLKSSI